MRTLLVLGGTGVVGARIARLAREQGVAERVLVGSRAASGADAVRIDVRDRASLARALPDADVVVNAVGPFEYDPRPLVAACAEHGCGYVDIAETEPFLDAVTDEAARRGVTAVAGASTVPGLVEVLAGSFDASAVARVRAYLSVGTGNEASATLIASMLAPIGRPLSDGGRAFDELVRVEHRGLGARVYGRYPSGADASGITLGHLPAPPPAWRPSRPEPVRTEPAVPGRPQPAPPVRPEPAQPVRPEPAQPVRPEPVEGREAPHAPRPADRERTRVPLELYFGCDRALYTHALGAASGVLGRSRRLASMAARAAMPLVPLVRALGTDVGVLRVVAIDRDGAEVASIEVRARRDGLDVPALPAVWAVSALSAPRPVAGPVRLCDLVSAEDAMTRLRAAGFEVILAGGTAEPARGRTRDVCKQR